MTSHTQDLTPEIAAKLAAVRAREEQLAVKVELDPAFVTDAKGLPAADIAAIETGLGVKLPRTYKALLATIVPNPDDAEFAFARMSAVAFARSWGEVFERIGLAGSQAAMSAVRARKLLPIGDDYGGHFWICLDLARTTPDGGDCAVVELNLECSPDAVAQDLEAQLAEAGDGLFEAIQALQDRFEKDVG